jgi:hypothetical protein
MNGERMQDETAPRLMYREDDAHFKRRLNSAIQLYWIYNSAVTILVCAMIFYLLDISLFIGIVVGLLILMYSNILQTLYRVTKTQRWEVYKDHAVMPRALSGGAHTVNFSEIEAMERRGGISGERMVIILKTGTRLSFDLSGQERPLASLEWAYNEYGKQKDRPQVKIVIPIAKG